MAQIIYGIHPVEEALKSSHVQIEKILVGTRTPQSSTSVDPRFSQ